ncbi:uncharacterized protein METZ01_LOCUS463773, partial [marine metagenome]
VHAQRVGIPAVPETDDVATGAQTWEQQSGAISCAFEQSSSTSESAYRTTAPEFTNPCS